MPISLLNPATKQFIQVDTGAVANETLLLNILIELRMQSTFLKMMVGGRCHDELNDMRFDFAHDAQSLTAGVTLLEI